MDRYQQNVRWLKYFAPFRTLAISAAYLTPFFLEKGLSLSEIFFLQSVFSFVLLALEVPSGWFADRFGRAFSIRLSAPIASAAFIAYGLSDFYWQFLLCEMALVVATSLLSGADTALLVDSLQAGGVTEPDNLEEEYTRQKREIDKLGYAATAAAVPVSFALVSNAGISAVIIADGVLIGIGSYFTWRLVEPPRFSPSQEEQSVSARHAMSTLGCNVHARWLITLGSVLSVSTYLAFWMSAPYYAELGIPAAWFGAILAVRSFWKFWLLHRFQQERRVERSMVYYAALAGLVYIAMATQQIWLV